MRSLRTANLRYQRTAKRRNLHGVRRHHPKTSMKHTRKSKMSDIPCLKQPGEKTTGKFGKPRPMFQCAAIEDAVLKLGHDLSVAMTQQPVYTSGV